MNNYQLPEGKVLVLRSCKSDMTSRGGFKWPESGYISAPDWRPNTDCGYGLHGWLWAVGDYELKFKEPGAKWLAVEVDADSVIELGGKVKFPEGNVIACGSFRVAYDVVMQWFWTRHSEILKSMETVDAAATYSKEDEVSVSTTKEKQHASAAGRSGHASAAGDYGHASAAGYSGHASAAGRYGHASAAGDYGHASAAGRYGHASAAGYYGHASAAGRSGHASAAGHYGHASAAGDYGTACVLGQDGAAKCGDNGSLILTYWDDQAERLRHVVGYAGENGIEAGTWYRLNDNRQFEKVTISE